MYQGTRRPSLRAFRIMEIFFLNKNLRTRVWIQIAAKCWAAIGLDQGFWIIRYRLVKCTYSLLNLFESEIVGQPAFAFHFFRKFVAADRYVSCHFHKLGLIAHLALECLYLLVERHCIVRIVCVENKRSVQSGSHGHFKLGSLRCWCARFLH